MSESQPPSGERVMSRFAADPDTVTREKPRRSDTGRTRFTPLDIQSHQFGRSLRGCDPGEVTSFLRLVAEDVERSVRESEELRERNRELEIRVDSLNEREEVLKRTLMTAQEVSEDIRNTAAREAEVILAEAEVKAEKVLDAAHRRVARLQEDIREMRSLRIRIATAVRTTIETHLALLEGLSEDPEADPILDAKAAHLARAKAPPDDRGAGEA